MAGFKVTKVPIDQKAIESLVPMIGTKERAAEILQAHADYLVAEALMSLRVVQECERKMYQRQGNPKARKQLWRVHNNIYSQRVETLAEIVGGPDNAKTLINRGMN